MGITAPGGFAEYVKSREFLTFPISGDVPLHHAAGVDANLVHIAKYQSNLF